jgi:hypothetical protein
MLMATSPPPLQEDDDDHYGDDDDCPLVEFAPCGLIQLHGTTRTDKEYRVLPPTRPVLLQDRSYFSMTPEVTTAVAPTDKSLAPDGCNS